MPRGLELLKTSLNKLQKKNRLVNLLGSLQAFVSFIHVILNLTDTFINVACVSQKSAVTYRQVADEVTCHKCLRRMFKSVTICAERSGHITTNDRPTRKVYPSQSYVILNCWNKNKTQKLMHISLQRKVFICNTFLCFHPSIPRPCV